MAPEGRYWRDILEAAPAEWPRLRLKEVFCERKERDRGDLPLLAVTGDRGVIPRDELDRRDTSSSDKSRYLRVARGDLVYNTMRMWQGFSGVSAHEGIVSPAYTVCQLRDLHNSEFIGYLCKLPALIGRFRAYSQGIVSDTLNLRFELFSEIAVPIPPADEQGEIAAILSSVDDAISATRKVIERTNRLKKGLLQALMTQGIGHTRFKKTEIGEIPEDWKVARLGDVYSERKEAGRPELRVMSVTLDRGLVPRDSLDRRVQSELHPSEHALARAGDLVYNTMRMWQGGSGVANETCIVSPAYIVAEPSESISPGFARYLFKSPTMIGRLFSYSQGITRDRLRLYFDNFSEVPAPLPPLEEQQRIADVLDRVNSLLAVQRRTVKKYRGLKRGLMQDLLTGRVRVQPD